MTTPKIFGEHEHLLPPNQAVLLLRQDQRITIMDSPRTYGGDGGAASRGERDVEERREGGREEI